MAALFDEFTSIVNALNDAKIDYAVCGGMAMAIHGFTRATVDIDVLILESDLERIWQLAKDLGYEVEGLPLSLHGGAIEIRRISKVEPVYKDLITLDCLLVTEALQDIWNERERMHLNELDVVTVSKTGLIKLKKMAGRTQDLADIENLSNER
ncbi:MAG: DUF6036 family nucleotidyltransferase [Pyrinomonadaceae bacterium]